MDTIPSAPTQAGSCGLNMKSHLWPHVFKHMGPRWWHCSWKTVETLRDRISLEEEGHRKWTLRRLSPGSLPVLLYFLIVAAMCPCCCTFLIMVICILSSCKPKQALPAYAGSCQAFGCSNSKVTNGWAVEEDANGCLETPSKKQSTPSKEQSVGSY